MSAPHTSQYLHNKKKTNSKIQKKIENLKRRQTKKFKTINKKKRKIGTYIINFTWIIYMKVLRTMCNKLFGLYVPLLCYKIKNNIYPT